MNKDSEGKNDFSEMEQIDNLYHFIEESFLILDNYMTVLSKFIEEEKKRTLNNSEVILTENWDYISWDHDIRPQLETSFFILTVSNFEKKIKEVCELVRTQKHVPIKQRELAGGFIISSHKYLKIFGGFNKPDDNDWKVIKDIYDTRNIYVHKNDGISLTEIVKEKFLHLKNENVDKYLKNYLANANNKEENTNLPPPPCESNIPMERFCYFALYTMLDFIKEMKREHVSIFSGLRILK